MSAVDPKVMAAAEALWAAVEADMSPTGPYRSLDWDDRILAVYATAMRRLGLLAIRGLRAGGMPSVEVGAQLANVHAEEAGAALAVMGPVITAGVLPLLLKGLVEKAGGQTVSVPAAGAPAAPTTH